MSKNTTLEEGLLGALGGAALGGGLGYVGGAAAGGALKAAADAGNPGVCLFPCRLFPLLSLVDACFSFGATLSLIPSPLR